VLIALCALTLLVASPAQAYFEDHPVQDAALTPVLHPIETTKKVATNIRHPLKFMQKCGDKALEFGKWYQTSGAEGCGNATATGCSIGLNVLLGLRNF